MEILFCPFCSRPPVLSPAMDGMFQMEHECVEIPFQAGAVEKEQLVEYWNKTLEWKIREANERR